MSIFDQLNENAPPPVVKQGLVVANKIITLPNEHVSENIEFDSKDSMSGKTSKPSIFSDSMDEPEQVEVKNISNIYLQVNNTI